MVRHNAIGTYYHGARALARMCAPPLRDAAARARVQQQTLRRLLAHAYARVPYYRRRFDEAGVRPADINAVADLARLPITGKEDLRRLPVEDRVAAGTDLDRCWRTVSSGSSGAPLSAYRDVAAACTFYALTARALRMAGARITDTLMAIGPGWYPSDLLVQRLGIGRVRSLSPLRQAAHLSADIDDWRPDVLHVYASVLKSLVAHLRASGHPLHRPRVIISSADFLDENTRADCREVFGVDPVQMYGSVETGRIGSECLARNGLHVFTDAVIPEFVQVDDVNGTRVCRVILTDLTNLTMPFIRYDQGDLAEVLGEDCACGLTSPRIQLLQTRSGDVVRLPGGGTVSALRLGAAFWERPDIETYKIVQEPAGTVIVRVVIKHGGDRDALCAAVADLELSLPGVHVRLELVDHIAPEPSGKVLRFGTSGL